MSAKQRPERGAEKKGGKSGDPKKEVARSPHPRGATQTPWPGIQRAPAFSLGNRVQPKVAVGPSGDAYEREADGVAQRVAGGGRATPAAISSLGAAETNAGQRQATGKPKDDEKKPTAQRADAPKEPEDESKARRLGKPDEKKDDKGKAPAVQKAAAPSKEDDKKKAAPVQRAPQGAGEKRENEAKSDLQRKVEPEKKGDDFPKPAAAAQRAEKPEERKTDKVKDVQRAPRPEEKEKAKDVKVQRAAENAAAGRVDDESSSGGARHGDSPSAHMDAAAERAITNKGAGEPLPEDVRSRLEGGMGADFSDVRVHRDSLAHETADALEARAFTNRNDIWLGRGESPSDIGLMAHEATHVVQQSGGVQRQVVQRVDTPGGDATTAASPEEADRRLKTFPLPQTKARHRPVYEGWAAAGNLKRLSGYDRGEPEQKDTVWLPGIKNDIPGLDRLHLDPSFRGRKTITVPPNERRIEGTYTELLNRIKVPEWDRSHRAMRPEVDHIVELQVGSWSGGSSGAANTLENMELLDKRSNASSGSTTRHGIRRKVAEFLRLTGQPDSPSSVTEYLAANDVGFERVEIAPEGVAQGQSQFWTKAEIESGKQLEDVQPVQNPGEVGSATSLALVSPGGGMVLGEYSHAADALTIAVSDAVLQRRVAGMRILSIALNQGYTQAAPQAQIGTVQAVWDLPSQVKAPAETMPLPLLRSEAGQYSGEIGSLPAEIAATFEGLSALRFSDIGFADGMLSAKGQLAPSIPLLAKVPLEVRLRGRAVEFVYYYRPTDLQLPIPGISIDDASLGVFFGTEGFGVEGSVDVSIPKVGRGGLSARIDSSKNFEATGRFEFDKSLFDRAQIDIWYRNDAFGGSGTLGIDTPNKIRGVKSATITASFSEGAFSATGTIQPSIPGVREASLTVAHSEAEGLTIGGALQLADGIPGIASGSLDAKVQRRPGEDRWVVSATGTAVPRIPGVAASLSVSYDDGAFDVSGTAAYERGMLKGSVSLGVTNRPVGDDGQPAGPPAPGAEHLTAYGGGSVTIRIAPWLQGTAAIRLLPNGEMEVTGTIGLPSTLDIFPEKRLDKNIFSIGLDIPIVGVAVAGQRIGIFANISGGLDLSAGIGPGQLQDCAISVTYNPAHEDQTHVSGSARLHIPAQAGLRLFVRGGLGAGIPIVSAQAGLEIGGRLGLEGAVDAGVQIDWTPTRGLVLDAFGEITVEPKLTFDVTGFVLVEADLLLTTIELYRKRWQLAAFEYGSGMRFGVKFPIHYEEGKPFDLSLSDVQFEVPQIDADSLLKGLVKQIA